MLLNSLSKDIRFVGVRFTVQKLSAGRGGGGGGAPSHLRLLLCKVVWSVKYRITNHRPLTADLMWARFLDAWARYKVMTKVSHPAEIRNGLQSTCLPVVNKLLFDFLGGHSKNTGTEEQLLAHIKSVAASGIHMKVHRQRFHSLRQSPFESTTHCLAQLGVHAALCEFNISCTRDTCVSHFSQLCLGYTGCAKRSFRLLNLNNFANF